MWLATSSATIRGICILPLHVHDEATRADIAYVMADGEAIWERLRAAADLYHMGRVKTISLLNEQRTSGYNFIRKRNDTRLQREIDYLGLFGVPASKILLIDPVEGDLFSSRSEAVGMKRMHPALKRIAIVTSSPHTRRAKLCFQRVYTGDVSIQVYSATSPSQSAETFSPIWIEYCKFFVYWICI